MTSADIDCVSCSADGSVCEDRNEAHGIAGALGECVTTLSVEAIKSVMGESLGVGGALQVASVIETMRSEALPGIHGLTEIEAEFPLRGACAHTRGLRVDTALINSIGFEGTCCSLVIGKVI